ncbi:MAG: ABC transporter permease, partial [Candidatus Micrarchaeota archaeon]
RDSLIFDRLLTNVSLAGIALSKLLFGLALALVQIFFLLATQSFLGAPIIEINFWSAYVIAASALSFTALGLSFVFLARFSELGRYLNVLAFGAVVVLSGIFYPIGFMPPLLQTVCKLAPTYYSVLLVRYFGVKGGEYALVSDYVTIITAFGLACLALLVFSIWRLRRG